MTEGMVRSGNAKITRKRLQASQAQNSTAVTPSTTGPWP
jgi:hypothetical protein